MGPSEWKMKSRSQTVSQPFSTAGPRKSPLESTLQNPEHLILLISFFSKSFRQHFNSKTDICLKKPQSDVLTKPTPFGHFLFASANHLSGTRRKHLSCRCPCRSRPLPAGFTVPPAQRQGRRLPGVARLARSRPRPLRAQRGGEGVCACSGNSNIQRHRGPRASPGAPKAGGERGWLLPQSGASTGLERERERETPRPLLHPHLVLHQLQYNTQRHQPPAIRSLSH